MHLSLRDESGWGTPAAMLKGPLIQPDILHALGAAGHGAKILVADANYPFSTMVSPRAKVVYLNVCPGLADVPTLVKLLNDAVPFESVEINVPDEGQESEVVGEVRSIVGDGVPITKRRRFEFYEACKGEQVCLVIATGETRIYSCVLVTIGYIPG